MSLEQAAAPTFANHQTFHPRFGWIKKGYDAARRDPGAFSHPSAPVDLGVGKNMVEAIRFWTLATKVIVRRPHPERPRISAYTPSRIGRAFFEDEIGLDPFLEDPATLWILHWHAVSERSILPVWRLAFNDFGALEFSEADLLQYCVDEIAATTWSQPMRSSVQKDVDCLLRMYSRRETRARQSLDDLLDSPFRELGLIQPAPGARSNIYRLIRGHKPTLPAAAITYACLDYLSRAGDGVKTVSLNRLATDPGGPGRLMKLTEQDIAEAVEESLKTVGHLRLARPAGSRQLAISAPAGHVAAELLTARYAERNSQLPRLVDFELVGGAATAAYLSDDQLDKEFGNARRRKSRAGKGAA